MTAPFHRVRLRGREAVGGALFLLTVEHPAEATYVTPGQYVEVRVEGSTGYFVISSDVGARAWQFVLRGGGGAADALLAMPIGAELEMTHALGDGFPCDAARGRRLLLVVTGSGIAAARPLAQRRIADADAARTTLLVGIRNLEEVALVTELDRWESAGVKVTVCLSQADGLPPDPAGRDYALGHVQQVVAARAAAHELGMPEMVFVVGSPTVVEEIRALAPVLGEAARDASGKGVGERTATVTVHTNY